MFKSIFQSSCVLSSKNCFFFIPAVFRALLIQSQKYSLLPNLHEFLCLYYQNKDKLFNFKLKQAKITIELEAYIVKSSKHFLNRCVHLFTFVSAKLVSFGGMNMPKYSCILLVSRVMAQAKMFLLLLLGILI